MIELWVWKTDRLVWCFFRSYLKMLTTGSIEERYKTTLLIHCGNCMVCHKMCCIIIIKHCTNNTFSHSSKLQSTGTSSCLPFTPKHSSILFQPRCPRIPISSRCVLCLSACLLIVCPNGRWNEWLLVSRSLTTGNPKSVASVYVSVVNFRPEWVRLVIQNCPRFVCH